MDLFIYFALPIATILLAIVLQKVLKSPILVGITFFAIYLIVAFVSFAENLAIAIIATIIYALIAFITAYIVKIIKCIYYRIGRIGTYEINENNLEQANLNTINNLNGQRNINGLSEINQGSVVNLNCSCENGNNNQGTDVAINANFTPYSNNGRIGRIRGCYRRL